MHRAPRVTAVLSTAAAVAFALALAALPASAAPEPEVPAEQVAEVTRPGAGEDLLDQLDQAALARAERRGADTVSLLVLTRPGATGSVADAVADMAGSVAYEDEKVGYLHVVVPADQVDAVAGLGAVQGLDVDRTITLPDPRVHRGQVGPAAARAPKPPVAPGSGTPNNNPYMPTRDTGAVAFKSAHPTWDGRGITIGVLDSGIDLDHPALQETSTGDPKIVDVFTATIPGDDPAWVPVPSTGDGTVVGLPAGSYRFGQLDEQSFAATELGGDLNRDGNPTGSSRVFAVAVDPATGQLWVDTNQNATFADDAPMLPFDQNQDVGHFGIDNPATGVDEQVAFGNGGYRDGYVDIALATDAHGTHVAGITAANGLFGGAMDGAAPGARIVAARACFGTGCSSSGLVDGMLALASSGDVEVINISIGGLPALNDGNNNRADLYNQTIQTYGVQLVISAGNSGPGRNTVGDPSVATDSVSVAASITNTTWKSNYNSYVEARNTLFNFSSRGPREDGGMKPTVTAPGSAVSSIPTWQPGAPVAETGYQLPAGYGMLNGTSMAAPQTTGDVALLLSAATQNGTSATPAQLRQSLTSGAQPIFNTPSVGQGAGLVDVPAAWDVLSRQPVVQGYTVNAPVCTALSDLLATPDAGTGLYNDCRPEDGGQQAKVAKTYPVTITRTSGPSGVQRHTVSWRGNDGAFSTAKRVDLPLNSPVTINVTVKTNAGDHSALLQLDVAATPGVDRMVLMAVNVARPLVGPSFAQSTTGTVARNQHKSVLVSVAPGTQALRVDLSGLAAGSQTRFIAFTPYGQPVESTGSLACYANFLDGNGCNPTSRTYADPIPGVWEFTVESRRTSPPLFNPFTLVVNALGVTVDPDPDTIAEASVGTPMQRSYTLTNSAAAVTVTPQGGPLVSVRRSTPTIAQAEQQQSSVTVPSGSSRLEVSIGSASGGATDLDLFVFNCTTGTCVLAGQSADGDSEETVLVNNPAAGLWVALVDGFAVPSGTATCAYYDGFTSSALGSLAVSGSPVPLAAGASAPLDATVTALAQPGAGRTLEGTLRLLSDGALVGSGLVRILAVTG